MEPRTSLPTIPVPDASPGQGPESSEQAMKLKDLKAVNESLDVEYVRRLRALYRGGKMLLGDREIMRRVFPKYVHEKDAVYDERCSRAFYENLMFLVVNQIGSGLAQDPARMEEEEEEPSPSKKPSFAKKDDDDTEDDETDDDETDDDDTEEKDEKDQDDEEGDEEGDEKPSPPPFTKKSDSPPPTTPTKKQPDYWEELMETASAPSSDGSRARSFDQLIRDVAIEGLVTGWGWVQTELPPPVVANSLKEQEDAGALEGYLVPWPTECVTDWYEENGELLWLKTYEVKRPRPDPWSDRSLRVHTWTVWTADSWTRYEVEVDDKTKKMPNDEETVAPTDSGKHSFRRVPWARFIAESPQGASLWVGDLIESLVRAYFNRQNGESFQWTQNNYQQLYEFLGPEVAGVDTMVSEAQQDTQRAKRRRAPGEVHVRGNEDRAEFVGPDMGGAEAGRSALQDLRDAVLRVVAQMALAQDTSGAMLRRSADSKRQDSVAQEIVIGAIGKLLVVLANKLVEFLAIGRGDDAEEAPRIVGYERFNVMDVESAMNLSVLAEQVDVPSATYQVEQKFQLACAHLGDNLAPDKKEKIRQELEGAITQDQIEESRKPPEPPPIPGVDDDQSQFQPGDPDQPPPPGGAPPFQKKPPFNSGQKKFGGGKPPFGAKKAGPPKPPFGGKPFGGGKKF